MRAIMYLGVFLLLICTACNVNTNVKENDAEVIEGTGETKKIERREEAFKILHIMSYHSPWEWTDIQLEGFQAALDGVNVEYKVFQMDTKNISSEEHKLQKGEEARALIESWKPDLVFASDDDAQQYVTAHYVNTSLPIVFSAINQDPAAYGFTDSKNVTGVLEYEHFVESVNLLTQVVPDVKKIAVVFDEDSMWEPVEARMKEQLEKVQHVEFVAWDVIGSFEQYKNKIREYEKTVDAIALIGIFTFTDEKGENMHYQDVLKWTAENSSLPDFSYWKDRTSYGTLAVVSISGYEQGYEAGKLAREILVEGKSPDSLPFRPSMKGEALINIARANELGIQVTSKVLLSSKVITEYEWEKKQ
ncbi:ABC transporter substrate-binding protein [Halalkalibacter urbisdiaboli]|uniref:ABC transporter substrate-binding protein n=1 Tax=Halalkalibacter urbisdiaboli TaxID=1960589 RepID=UPI000B44AED4|nr:ABC transporter substrate binding protein [Halalkalibacter urbisdiaboli]